MELHWKSYSLIIHFSSFHPSWQRKRPVTVVFPPLQAFHELLLWVISTAYHSYFLKIPAYLTRIRYAVVWGGILAVWKLAWVISTSCPGRRSHKRIGSPFRFRMIVEFVILYLVILLILLGIPARSWLLLQSIQTTRWVVVLTEGLEGCLVTIVNAADCGGMLRVMFGENVASTRMPLRISLKRIGIPREFITAVFWLIFSRSCWIVVIPLCHGTE